MGGFNGHKLRMLMVGVVTLHTFFPDMTAFTFQQHTELFSFDLTLLLKLMIFKAVISLYIGSIHFHSMEILKENTFESLPLICMCIQLSNK